MIRRQLNAFVFLVLVRTASIAIRIAKGLVVSHPALRYEIT